MGEEDQGRSNHPREEARDASKMGRRKSWWLEMRTLFPRSAAALPSSSHTKALSGTAQPFHAMHTDEMMMTSQTTAEAVGLEQADPDFDDVSF